MGLAICISGSGDILGHPCLLLPLVDQTLGHIHPEMEKIQGVLSQDASPLCVQPILQPTVDDRPGQRHV